MVIAGLLLTAALLVTGGFTLGTRRGRNRERSLKATIAEQTEKLNLVAHELLRYTNLDPVTELPTQQSVQEFLEREWRRASRERRPVSLIMIEVDHFRAYNDLVGRPQADACLKSIAATLKDTIHRPGDFVARYGAGKFAIVLGGTGQEGAIVLTERLRERVNALRVPNPASATGSLVTLSLGVASAIPERDAPWQDIALIATAERALAQAREDGRDRVAFQSSIQAS